MEELGAEPGVCAQAGEDPGVGGRGWAGPRGAVRPKLSGKRTRREQEAVELSLRPEVSGTTPGKGSAMSRGGAASPVDWAQTWALGGANLGHLDPSPQTDGQAGAATCPGPAPHRARGRDGRERGRELRAGSFPGRAASGVSEMAQPERLQIFYLSFTLETSGGLQGQRDIHIPHLTENPNPDSLGAVFYSRGAQPSHPLSLVRMKAPRLGVRMEPSGLKPSPLACPQPAQSLGLGSVGAGVGGGMNLELLSACHM